MVRPSALKNKNVGKLDGIVRIVFGLGAVYIGFVNQSIITDSFLNLLLGIFGVVNIGAAVAGWCPFYALARLNTVKPTKE